MDIGTSAWGKPMDSGSSWDDPGREKTGNGWNSQSQHKSGESENKCNSHLTTKRLYDVALNCSRVLFYNLSWVASIPAYRLQDMIVLRSTEWCVCSLLDVSHRHRCPCPLRLPSAGPKPVQNSWDGEMTMPAPSNWGEEEEVEIGMWNNNTPQEVNQSGNWSYSKKVPPKVAICGCVPDSTVCLACDGRHESLFYSLGYFSRFSVKK